MVDDATHDYTRAVLHEQGRVADVIEKELGEGKSFEDAARKVLNHLLDQGWQPLEMIKKYRGEDVKDVLKLLVRFLSDQQLDARPLGGKPSARERIEALGLNLRLTTRR